ncbi:MAG: carbohydrate kinase family protein, partial [Actinomycetota bacterium]
MIIPGRDDRTILAFKGVNNNLTIKDVKLDKIKTKWLYVSSMLGQSLETAESIVYLAKKRKTKVAINLSLYVANKGLEELSPLLSSADIIILNKEEAQALTKEKDIDKVLNKMYEHTYAKIAITSGSGHIIASDSLRVYSKQIHPIN